MFPIEIQNLISDFLPNNIVLFAFDVSDEFCEKRFRQTFGKSFINSTNNTYKDLFILGLEYKLCYNCHQVVSETLCVINDLYVCGECYDKEFDMTMRRC